MAQALFPCASWFVTSARCGWVGLDDFYEMAWFGLLVHRDETGVFAVIVPSLFDVQVS
jgi:hypothetical protein